MSLLRQLFRNKKQPKSSANLAKERLQIIVSHERHSRNAADFLPQLQEELVAVIAKYVQIDKNTVKVQLEHHDDQSILELNLTLPDICQEKSSEAEKEVSAETEEV